MSHRALGLIETRGLIGAIEATDVAAKTADVTICAIGPSDAPTITLKIEGELAAVQAAVEAGARAAQRLGLLVASHVIPKPHDALTTMLSATRDLSSHWTEPPVSAPAPVLPKASVRAAVTRAATPSRRTAPKPKPVVRQAVPAENAPVRQAAAPVVATDVEAMPVVKLRQYCRTIAGFPLQGRQISMANKQQLLESLKGMG